MGILEKSLSIQLLYFAKITQNVTDQIWYFLRILLKTYKIKKSWVVEELMVIKDTKCLLEIKIPYVIIVAKKLLRYSLVLTLMKKGL